MLGEFDDNWTTVVEIWFTLWVWSPQMLVPEQRANGSDELSAMVLDRSDRKRNPICSSASTEDAQGLVDQKSTKEMLSYP